MVMSDHVMQKIREAYLGTPSYYIIDGEQSEFTKRQLIQLYYFHCLQLSSLGTIQEQQVFLSFIKLQNKEIIDRELKFAIKLMQELFNAADDRYYIDRLQYQYQYYYPVQRSHVTVHHYHNSSFWDYYFLWSIMDLNSRHCHGYHHCDSNGKRDSEADAIIAGVFLGLALCATAYMVLEQFIKAGHDIADGQVAQGSLIMGSSLLVGAGTGLIVFMLAASTFAGPIGLLGGCLIIAAAMLISANLSKMTYAHVANSYELTNKEEQMLSLNGYNEYEISDIKASIKRYNALCPSDYVSIWSDKYKLERELKNEIRTLKGLATNSLFGPIPSKLPTATAIPVTESIEVEATPVEATSVKVYPVIPTLPEVKDPDGTFRI